MDGGLSHGLSAAFLMDFRWPFSRTFCSVLLYEAVGFSLLGVVGVVRVDRWPETASLGGRETVSLSRILSLKLLSTIGLFSL